MKRASQAHRNRVIVVMAEGDTERAALRHVKAFLDGRAGGSPKVRLQPSIFDGGLREAEVRGRAERFLRDRDVVGVVALVDVYPQFRAGAEDAKKVVSSWLPADARCHVHVAKHDFEAWLLPGWEAILKLSGAKAGLKPWGSRPEEINHDRPPAHRLAALFRQGKPARKYKKPIEGQRLFEQLDLAAVAVACPEFKAFLNTLLTLAGSPPLP